MEIYVVGGAVRDVMLDIIPSDIDFVVINSTPIEMIKLGYTPIAATSFPVFHDSEHQEFALARKEYKSGDGYHGFDCEFGSNITLEEDLFRRDITMNSMAVHIDDWEYFKKNKDLSVLIDPYGGTQSIDHKKIKHTSRYFSDDPVRAIRTIRFANKYGFQIRKSTKTLIQNMSAAGTLDHLTPERIWLEITKVFEQSLDIGGFFELCEELKVFEKIIPDFCGNPLFIDYKDLTEYNKSNIVDDELAFLSTINTNSLYHITDLCKKLKIPNRFLKIFKIYDIIQSFCYEDFDSDSIIKCLEDTGSYNDFSLVQKVISFFINIEMNFEKECYILRYSYNKTKDISFKDLTDIQKSTLKGKDISDAISEMKINLLKNYE